MTAEQRRITLALSVMVGLTLLVATGLTFLVSPMAESLGLSDNVVEDILVIPALAAFPVVFVAGRAGDRLGQRRTMLVASLVFTLGSAVLACAGGQFTVMLGLALCGAGAIVIQVVAVSLLQRTASEGRAHVSAFTTYGMVFPLAFLVLPIVTSALLGDVGWRWIPICWAVAGLLIALIAVLFLEPGSATLATGEWVTPILAGVALAAGSLSLSEIDNVEVEPWRIAIGACIGAAAALACWLVMRRLAHPSFSLAPIRGVIMRTLMLGVVILSLMQMLTYICIFLEYFYDMTALQASIVVAPAQVGAVIGAKLVAKRAIGWWGVTRSGRVLMLVTGVTMLPLLAMQLGTPVWYLVIVATLFSCAGMAALTVLNIDVMGRAPADSTGAVSSLRTAASTIGTALGMAVLGTVILSSVPVDAGNQQVSPLELESLAGALRTDGLLGFLAAVTGWILLIVAARRIDSPRTANA
ncbi:MAG: hypothetical protein RL205_1078 [Actinomycetota bacterium]|jgi:MFS family permease